MLPHADRLPRLPQHALVERPRQPNPPPRRPLQALVGTDFNFEGLVKSVLKLRSFNLDFEVHTPRLLLSISSLWIIDTHECI